MEYFVTAENTPYYQWQLELLIESFRYHGLEDSLFIVLFGSDQPAHPLYCRNIFGHKRLLTLKNIGNVRGYSRLNRLHGLSNALRFGFVKQPLAILDADMVLYRPLDTSIFQFSGPTPEIVFTPDVTFTPDYVEEQLGVPFESVLPLKKEAYLSKWVPLGSVFCLNNIPPELVEFVDRRCEEFAYKQLLSGREEIWEETDRLAWAGVLRDYLGKVSFTANNQLEMNMLSNGNANFVHYEHGLPPVFNKAMFRFTNALALGDPFAILAEHFPTPAAHFMNKLAKIQLDSRPDMT